MHILTHNSCCSMHEIYVSLSQIKSQQGARIWAHNAAPSHGATGNSKWLWLKETFFSKSEAYGKLNTLNQRSHIQEYLGSMN